MPYTAVELKPGVNTQKTLSLNQAGVSISQLLRYKEGLIETLGAWTQFTPSVMGSTVRDLHAWQDAAAIKHLAVGCTAGLSVITAGSETGITPQTATTNFAVNFSSTLGSPTITVIDSNSSGLPSVFNTVFFNTPVAVAGFLLQGAYQINTVLSSISFTITASANSTANVTSSGILPIFSTTAGSAAVTVGLPNHTFTNTIGTYYDFRTPTTVDGVIVDGPYQIRTIVNSSTAIFNVTVQASGSTSATMNSSLAQLVYYVTQGPQPLGSGFGAAGFGSGGFGTGVGLTGAAGVDITTTDWTMDNWGQVLMACPKDGPIYSWSPDSGFFNAEVITEAPFQNGGIFISMPQQILVAWRSCQNVNAAVAPATGISAGTQSNLLVRWCDAGDYTNWEVSNTTTAGSFTIPTGSIIRGGIQGPSQGLIWTDVDVWAMQYIGGTLIFNFTRIGSGCGAVGPQCMGTLNGVVFWMGPDNFFMLGPNGVQVVPCTVWDSMFQNINEANIEKVRCAPNSAFNEISWFYPSANATENDSYVKYNIVEGEWDYGMMPRTAWQDVSVLGNPIGASTDGTLQQHEEGEVQSGVSATSFQSGWWTITEGNDMAFVDFVIPDFKFGTYSTPADATIQITFLAADYPGDTPRTYGPYTITAALEYITPRIRGRLMSVQVQGNGSSYWRLGRIRYRFALAGRR